MAESEVDVIAHLLEVENQASVLIDDSQTESNKRILEAKAKADELFYEKYRDVISDLEQDCDKTINKCEENHKQTFDDYKNQILGTEKDLDSFNSFMDKVVSG
ncbi:MAG: hypothetical protein J6Y36_01105 [Treponema sp.]|nr:hypothetical protein [Treponema sp.]